MKRYERHADAIAQLIHSGALRPGDRVLEPSAGVGMVPAENLVGKAEIIMFSWSPGASLFNPVSWFANLRPSRFFKILD